MCNDVRPSCESFMIGDVGIEMSFLAETIGDRPCVGDDCIEKIPLRRSSIDLRRPPAEFLRPPAVGSSSSDHW